MSKYDSFQTTLTEEAALIAALQALRFSGIRATSGWSELTSLFAAASFFVCQ